MHLRIAGFAAAGPIGQDVRPVIPLIEAVEGVLDSAFGDMRNQIDPKRDIGVEAVPTQEIDGFARTDANLVEILRIVGVDGNVGAWTGPRLGKRRSGQRRGSIRGL